ncbi:hypothetical protein D3C75_1303790 [compost metagenome]
MFGTCVAQAPLCAGKAVERFDYLVLTFAGVNQAEVQAAFALSEQYDMFDLR